MQNNIKNNDSFSELVRQKLESHQTPVDPAVWDAIESKMAARKAKRHIPLGWWLTAGMAAAVALLLTLAPFGTQTETNFATSTPKQKPATNSEINHSDIKPEIAVSQSVKQNNYAAKATQPKQLHISEIQTTKDTASTANANNPATALNTETGTTKPATETPTMAQQIQEVKQNATVMNDTIKAGATEKLQPKQPVWEDPLKEKSNENWELIAMVGGTGKSSQTSNAVLQTTTLRPRMSIVKAEKSSAYIFSPEEFTDKTYMAPLTAGLAVSRSIGKKLSIETGINYSYLLSTFKNNQLSANLNLHYMGIPARIAYQLTSGSKWNMYAAAGGMVEKGLWSVYVQEQKFESQTITTTVSNKIDGFQWSVNAAIGGEYILARSAAIYFEPKVSYYFDNNQPISSRTVNKLVIGFEGGLRYKF